MSLTNAGGRCPPTSRLAPKQRRFDSSPQGGSVLLDTQPIRHRRKGWWLMPTVEEFLVIKRPRTEVFAFASDPANVPLYNSNLVEYEKTSEGPVTKGTTYRGLIRVAGKSIPWTSELVEFEEGHRSVNRSIESPMAWEIESTYEDFDGGTKVTFHQETAAFGGFFGRLADPLVTRMYARDVRSNLEKLKELLEA